MKSAALESKSPAGGLKRALAFVVAISVMALAGVFSSGSVSAAPQTGSVTTDFTNQGGPLIANGTATVTNAAGATDTQAFAVPVAQVTGTCEILNLVLGP